MAYPTIIGRMSNRSIINSGFSENGGTEEEMAELLSELDMSLYAIDCLSNMIEELVEEQLETLLDILAMKLEIVSILIYSPHSISRFAYS